MMTQGRLIMLMMAMVIAIAVMGVGFAWSSTTLETHSVSTGYFSLGFTSVTCGDPPGTLDLDTVPNKDVGWTECVLVDSDHDGDFDVLEITVNNAYPGYQVEVSDIIVTNLGTLPAYITSATLNHNDDPVAVVLESFWTETNMTCELVDQGEYVAGEFWVYLNVTQPALQGHTYTFQIDITGEQWNQTCAPEDLGGTPGFWKNWDAHNTYTQQQIEAWLDEIDGSSLWLGPTTVEDMEEVFDPDSSAAEPKFLKHYLATRLNAASGRLALTKPHNISAIDPGNYLGLADNSAATLADIIAAIEAKFGTSPTSSQFLIMKNVCDALNNLLA